MRISTALRLIALGLIAGSLSASPLAARPPVSEVNKTLIDEEFIGYGTNETAARKDALDHACRWLKESSGLDWYPDSDYLLNHKLVQFCEPEDREFEDVKDVNKDGNMKVLKCKLEIKDYQARDIQKQAQQQRMKERQKPTVLGLLGVMGLIGVVGGYLRLEEATKGYYTHLLRMAAIGVVAVIVAGLCVAG